MALQKTQGKIQRTFCQGSEEEVENKLTSKEIKMRKRQKSAMAGLTQNRIGTRAEAGQDQEAQARKPLRLKSKMAKSYISCLEVYSASKNSPFFPQHHSLFVAILRTLR